MKSWNKGKTASTDARIAKGQSALKKYYETHPGTMLGKHHTEKTKEIISIKRKQYLRENPDKHVWKRNSKFISVPCEALKDELRKKGVAFVEEYCPFKDSSISIDIAFPNLKIGVEVNGNQHYSRDGELKNYYKVRHDKLTAAGWTIYEIHYTLCYNIHTLDDILKLDVYNKTYINSYFSNLESRKKKRLEKQRIKEENEQRKLHAVEERKNKILTSNIDFTKFGWLESLSTLLQISHSTTTRWLKRHMPEFYAKCYSRIK